MAVIGDKRSKETAEKVARQKELAKVVIKKEDVELIVRKELIAHYVVMLMILLANHFSCQ